ncbi:MAG: hypothetical protein U0414_14155 [Polyangiaceae bacterium]
MRRRAAHLALMLLFGFAASCDDGGAGTGGTSSSANNGTGTTMASTTGNGTTGSGTSSSSGGGCTVPLPGTVEGGDWTDAEPNDDACHATPVGILSGPVWAGFADPITTINSNTDKDFFVFKTSDAASLANVNVLLCSSGTFNLLDLYLYGVEADGTLGPEIKKADSTQPGCETIVAMGEGPTDLQPNTTYVLEVRAAPGLVLPKPSDGFYSA